MFSAATLRPMLASLPPSEPPLTDPSLVYEPKYDGIRAIALVEPARRARACGSGRGSATRRRRSFPSWSRRSASGADRWPGRSCSTARSSRSMPRADPPGFSGCRSRIHVTVPGYRSSKPILRPDEQPTAFIAFDSAARRRPRFAAAAAHRTPGACSSALFAKHKPPSSARFGCQRTGRRRRPRAAHARAQKEGWEGLLVKHARSLYRDGRRSPEWRKLKIQHQDEFVIGGWTEPKGGAVPISGR